MPFCEHCGTQVSEAAKFCASCGNPTGVPPGAGVASQPSPAPTSPAPTSPTTRLILGVVALLVLLACLGLGAAFYMFHRVSTKADELTQGLPGVAQGLP